MKVTFQKRKKKVQKITQAARNKAAFDEVIGDPFGYPEPIDGHYFGLRHSSFIKVGNTEPQSRGTVNQARPNEVDFLCDVEAAVRDGILYFIQNGYEGPNDVALLQYIFDNTYLLGTGDVFNQRERAQFEQIVGNIFRQRGISPISKYFTIIKQ